MIQTETHSLYFFGELQPTMIFSGFKFVYLLSSPQTM